MKYACLFSGIGAPLQAAYRVYENVEHVFSCEYEFQSPSGLVAIKSQRKKSSKFILKFELKLEFIMYTV